MGDAIDQPMSKTQGWLKIFRISNAPTIISNVFVGLALALTDEYTSYSNPLRLITISVALLLVYFAGMVLNDAIDAKRDATLRPERPIPMGVVKVQHAWLVGCGMLLCSLLLSVPVDFGYGATVLMLLLVIGVLAYTFLHQWLIPAIVFIALCRALVYFIALQSISPPPPFGALFVFCAAIAMYVGLLTFIGWKEHEKRTRNAWLVSVFLLPAIVPAYLNGGVMHWVWLVVLVYAVWMWMAWKDFSTSKNQMTAGMHKLLAGFCLLDCVFIASIGEFSIMIAPALCFVITNAAHRKIAGS